MYRFVQVKLEEITQLPYKGISVYNLLVSGDPTHVGVYFTPDKFVCPAYLSK
jgi:hypothetical protein